MGTRSRYLKVKGVEVKVKARSGNLTVAKRRSATTREMKMKIWRSTFLDARGAPRTLRTPP